MGDPENKRKRYCLMCNVFKPDRCHHCSTCNRCVLNMDHHCPWVNNCIGFWNRKHFLLLLFYGVGSLFIYILGVSGKFVETIQWYISLYYEVQPITVQELVMNVTVDVTYLFALFLTYTLTKFTHFHVTLVRRNSTTLESLENKGLDYENAVSTSLP
eukprot:TRINITY_DN5217_c0_g5_i1.p2 TRINITY_DN5217_c0_g5~~TRINITY_DN5217_c0_g5_i1.p2  ORF type:complete len:157 (+),score=18.40 TRINITY_DN5217_c0_g5_i1:420-890(+)